MKIQSDQQTTVTAIHKLDDIIIITVNLNTKTQTHTLTQKRDDNKKGLQPFFESRLKHKQTKERQKKKSKKTYTVIVCRI